MQNHHSRTAYTLVEILVATAVSLILMLAVMKMFSGIGTSLNKTRAEMNLALELRRVADMLNRDLDKRSLQTVTSQVTGGHGGTNGYFTYQEGPMWTPSDDEPRLQRAPVGLIPAASPTPRTAIDMVSEVNGTTTYPAPAGTLSPQQSFFSLNMASNPDTGEPDSTVGDLDDQLAFTVEVRPTDPPPYVPYRGRGIDPTFGLTIVESSQAEVAWFVRGTTLYRRVLLIDGQADEKSYAAANNASANLKDNRTDVELTNNVGDTTRAILYNPNTTKDSLWGTGKWVPTTGTPLSFYDIFDVSVRWANPIARTDLVPNLLGNLADRRNRFGSNRNPSLPYPSSYECLPSLGDQCLPAGLIVRLADNGPPYGHKRPTPSLPAMPELFAVGGDFWDDYAVTNTLQPYGQETPLPDAKPPLPNNCTQPRRGEDAVLKNVLSFDVKAWIDNDGTPAYFADLGWRGTAEAALLASGYTSTQIAKILPATTTLVSGDADYPLWQAYNIGTTTPGHYDNFSIAGRYGDSANLPTGTAQMSCIYDTWWTDTITPPPPPPYGLAGSTNPAELRAIQVTLRVYEPQFKVVQEVRLVKVLE
ncbi:MAG: PulJ/GspJ family protein [Thermoguttaceae bacterium]